MFLSAFGASKPLSAADPSYSSVEFLQTFDALTVNTFPEPFVSEKSGTQWTFFNPPNTAIKVVSSPSRFGNGGQLLAGHSKYIQGNQLSSDFTFEFSILNPTAIGLFTSTFASSTSSFYFALSRIAGSLLFKFEVVGIGTVATNVVAAPNTWYDFAIARDSGLVRVFINGTQACSFLYSTNVDTWTFIRDTTYNWIVDDIRISNICRYTANYTPSHPFLNQ